MKQFNFKLPITLHECPDSMIPHMQKIFMGEYEVPIAASNIQILDIGANIGGFALWAAHRWPGSKIHCYEPCLANYRMLDQNTQHFRKNIEILNVGVGPSEMTTLYHGINNCGEATLFKQDFHTTSEKVEIMEPVYLPLADILKIDTEGCEVGILRRLLDDKRVFSAVMLEYHSEADRRSLDELLTEYTLVGSEAHGPHRGTVKYLNRQLIA